MKRKVSKSDKLFILRLTAVLMGINIGVSLYQYGVDGMRLLVTILVIAVLVPAVSMLLLPLFRKNG